MVRETVIKKTIPDEWMVSRMSMIYKGKGDKSDIRNYRPITVTPVIYRLVMQIIKNRLDEWIDCEGMLGELQLWLAFLDIKSAHDNVNQRILWDIVESLKG